MKKPILMLFFLLPILLFGQVKFSEDFTVYTGSAYKVVDAKDKEYFSDGKGNAISVKTQDLKVTIQRFDVQGMKEINRNEYTDLPKESRVEKILKVGDRLFYFHSTENKSKTLTLYAREINMNDGTFKPAKVLFETQGTVAGSFVGMDILSTSALLSGGRHFEVIESFDHSKILIKYRRTPLNISDKVNYDIIGFYSFNVSFEKQWGGELKMPYTEKEMNNLAYSVGKDGTAYMLAFINEAKRFELFVIKDATAIKTIKLDVDGKLMFQELKMAENVDGNIVCTGYYANGVDVKVSWQGYVSLSFNTFTCEPFICYPMTPAGIILEKYKYDFPLPLINQYESARAKEKNAGREEDGKAGINDLRLRISQENADGSAIIVGEQMYVRKELMYTQTQNVYYYGDIIVTKIDKSGKLLWMIKLPKTQVGLRGRGGNGIKYIMGDGFHYILFLDNKKNSDISKDAVPAKHQDAMGGYLNAS